MKRISFLLCIAFMLSLLGCGVPEPSPATIPPVIEESQSAESDSVIAKPEDEIITEENPVPTETEPVVMAAPALGDDPDGPKVMIFTDYYTLYLPKEWCDTCVF